MPTRGTKKTAEALEVLFETGKKPTQQDFFDVFSSFYHKDEDISFLINIAKATQTDAQVGSNHGRFMTALRTYQSILWWVRLARHPLLMMDVSELIDDRITATLNELMATDDGDNIINTLGELLQAFESFNEEIGGIDALRSRIVELESILFEVPGQQRQVQDTFDSLFNLVSTAQAAANAAQSTANNATSLANAAQSTANNATSLANTAQSTADNATSLANTAQSSANNAQSSANNAQSSADYNHAYLFSNGGGGANAYIYGYLADIGQQWNTFLANNGISGPNFYLP